MNKEKNLRMAKAWLLGATFPWVLMAMVYFGDVSVGMFDVLMGIVLASTASIGASTMGYANYLSLKSDERRRSEGSLSLRDKLELLEDDDIIFQAGYLGYGEIFTAQLPDGTFIDYHWMDTGSTEQFQYFKPTEFEKAVDETLEKAERYFENRKEEEDG